MTEQRQQKESKGKKSGGGFQSYNLCPQLYKAIQ